MAQAKYDWRAVGVALVNTQDYVWAARRHMNHGKRAKVLSDITAAEYELAQARQALEQPAPADVDGGAGVTRTGCITE